MLDSATRDRQAAAARHGVAGVDGQVRDHLLELAAVGLDKTARVCTRRQPHVGAEQPCEQVLQPANDRSDVEHLRLEYLAAAEGEQLVRQRRRALGGTCDLERVLAARVIGVEAGDEKLGVAPDRGQQVVEIVRNPAGEATDSLELLRVQELLLELEPLGDVAVVQDYDLLAVPLVQAADGLDRAPASVSVAQAQSDRRRLLACEDRGEDRVRTFGVVRMAEREVLRADELLRLPPEDALHRRALVQARPVWGQDCDHVRGVLDQRAEVLLALTQRFMRLKPFGDVLADRDEAGRCSGRVAQERAAPVDRPLLAVARADRALEMWLDLTAGHAVEVVLSHGLVVPEVVEPVLADDLLAAPAG